MSRAGGDAPTQGAIPTPTAQSNRPKIWVVMRQLTINDRSVRWPARAVPGELRGARAMGSGPGGFREVLENSRAHHLFIARNLPRGRTHTVHGLRRTYPRGNLWFASPRAVEKQIEKANLHGLWFTANLPAREPPPGEA